MTSLVRAVTGADGVVTRATEEAVTRVTTATGGSGGGGGGGEEAGGDGAAREQEARIFGKAAARTLPLVTPGLVRQAEADARAQEARILMPPPPSRAPRGGGKAVAGDGEAEEEEEEEESDDDDDDDDGSGGGGGGLGEPGWAFPALMDSAPPMPLPRPATATSYAVRGLWVRNAVSAHMHADSPPPLPQAPGELESQLTQP